MPRTDKNAVSFSLLCWQLQALDTILWNPEIWKQRTTFQLLASAFESKSYWKKTPTYLKSNIFFWWLSFQANPCPALFHHTATEAFQLLQEAGKVKILFSAADRPRLSRIQTNVKVKNLVKRRRFYLPQPGRTERRKECSWAAKESLVQNQ